MSTQSGYARYEGEGWISFAGVMIMVLAVVNIVWGIAGISKSSFFVGETKLIFDNIRTWGWIVLFIGILQGFIGYGILARNQAARWAGVAIAALNLLAVLSASNASPFWALVVVAIDIAVIYGLAAYGGRIGTT